MKGGRGILKKRRRREEGKEGAPPTCRIPPGFIVDSASSKAGIMDVLPKTKRRYSLSAASKAPPFVLPFASYGRP